MQNDRTVELFRALEAHEVEARVANTDLVSGSPATANPFEFQFLTGDRQRPMLPVVPFPHLLTGFRIEPRWRIRRGSRAGPTPAPEVHMQDDRKVELFRALEAHEVESRVAHTELLSTSCGSGYHPEG